MADKPSPGDAIDRFMRMLDKGDVHIFTPEDAAKLRELAQDRAALSELVKIHKRSPGALSAWVWWYDTLKSVAIIGGGLQRLLVWFIFIAGVWIAFKQGLADFIFKMAAGAK